MKLWVRVASLGAAVLLLASPALAGEARSHDGGFFLRLTLGGGYSKTEIGEGGDKLAFKGTSGSFDVALGAVVTRNLAVHATLGGWGLVDPDAEFNGSEATLDDTSITVALFGGGLTYYFGDSNAYITGSVGAAQMRMDYDGDYGDSDTGVAADFGIGKEWWVSDSWGLGVSATVGFHSIPPGEGSDNFKGTSFAVRFSATHN